MTGIYKMTLQERFWSRVKIGKPDECWNWTAYVCPRHYPIIKYHGVTYSGHRLSYEFNVGKIPCGLHVLHKCDNQSCVNPDHIFLGTQADNIRDCVSKSRNAHGENHVDSKLTESAVREIRLNYKPSPRKKARDTMPFFAKKFGVSERTIFDAIKCNTWKHV